MEQTGAGEADQKRQRLADIIAEVYASDYEISIVDGKVRLERQSGYEQINKSEDELLEMLKPYEADIAEFLRCHPEPWSQIASAFLTRVSDAATRTELRELYESWLKTYADDAGYDKHNAQRLACWDMFNEAKHRRL
jgi:hypothetical protein